MPTLFPGGIDSFVNPSAGSQLNDAAAPHASSHDNLQDGMTAVQTFVLGAISSSLSGTLSTLAVASLSSLNAVRTLGVITASQYAVFNNRIMSAGGTGIVATSAAGVNASVVLPFTFNQNDMAGALSIWTAGTPAAGAQAIVKFSSAYFNAPFVTLTPASPSAAGLQSWVGASGNSFTVNFGLAQPTGSVSFFYHVVGDVL